MKENEKPAGLHNKLNDVFAPRWLTGGKDRHRILLEFYKTQFCISSLLLKGKSVYASDVLEN